MMQDFVQQIADSTRNMINGVHTAFPGTIVSIDTGSGTAVVRPSMKFRKPDGTQMIYPDIYGVPIVIPQAAGQEATIAYPIKSGDGCLVVISEQSLDYWMYGRETETDLHFDLSDAICIPGLFNKGNPALAEAISSNAVVVKAPEIVFHGNVTVNGNFTTQGGTVRLN